MCASMCWWCACYAPDPWKWIFYKLETVYPSSSCITLHLNVRTMSRVARIAAYMIISPLRASDRSYRSPRALARSFEPLWRVQHLDLPSSTSTHYREKHRSTISLHQTGRTTFKLVGSAHRRSSDTSHSSEQQKRRSKHFEACLRQCVKVEDRSALRRCICTPPQCLETHRLVQPTLSDLSTSCFGAFEPHTIYQD